MSQLEDTLAFQIKACRLPKPEREVRFAPPRLWRFDFAWPGQGVAVECEGGVFSGGRHTRGRGFEDDCVKYNEAALLGYRVLRVTERHITSGEAITWLERALKGAGRQS